MHIIAFHNIICLPIVEHILATNFLKTYYYLNSKSGLASAFYCFELPLQICRLPFAIVVKYLKLIYIYGGNDELSKINLPCCKRDTG